MNAHSFLMQCMHIHSFINTFLMWQVPTVQCMYFLIVFLSYSDSNCKMIGRVYFYPFIRSHLCLLCNGISNLSMYEKYTNLQGKLLQQINYIRFCMLNWEMIFHHPIILAILKEVVMQTGASQTIKIWKLWMRNFHRWYLCVVWCLIKWIPCELWSVTN